MLKTLVLFIVIGFLNTFIFIVYLSNTRFPGGEVGMAPFGIMLGSAIASVGSLLAYLLIRRRIEMTVTKSILTYQFAYALTLIIGGLNPWDNDLSDIFKKLSQWTYLISFMVTVGLIVIIKLFDRFKVNRT